MEEEEKSILLKIADAIQEKIDGPEEEEEEPEEYFEDTLDNQETFNDFMKYGFKDWEWKHWWNFPSRQTVIEEHEMLPIAHIALREMTVEVDRLKRIVDSSGNSHFLEKAERDMALVEEIRKERDIAVSDKQAKDHTIQLQEGIIESYKGKITELSLKCKELEDDLRKLKDATMHRGEYNALESGKKNSGAIGNADGISSITKKKAIFLGVNALGWELSEMKDRFNIEYSSIVQYYAAGKREWKPSYEMIDGEIKFIIETSWMSTKFKNDKGILNIFTDEELECIAEWYQNGSELIERVTV